MNQRADHPHHAAVHLIKALKCCQQCSNSDQIDLIQIRQLQYRKNILAQQLKQINIRGQSVDLLQSQISQLDQLILRLKNQNQLVQKQGLKTIQMAVQQRKMFQNQQISTIITQLQTQVELNKQLKRQMEMLMERMKYLNRVNNQLVYNFCNY